ncbi:hypothetical protein [Marinomonas colpomeniae]|uniref:Uncharacterized protein n=1 Tax=Marinomonas colpomeniae TaxID=2774408 RepID=A0ABR8NXF4_9GAMM|nr:hypothetical protein [Marinomonas colpomeniae]MBD5770730.1 hypothetical protein [Marinomonas colpomeniae]
MIRGENEFLEASSERECVFYAEYLVQHIKSASLKNLRGLSYQEKLKGINDELEVLIKKNRAPKNFASQMRTAFRAAQIPSQYFRWIDKNDQRLCNWAWCYLKSRTSEQNPENEKKPLALSAKSFNTDRDSVLERHADIIGAFYDGEADIETQQSILEHLKAKWQDVRLNETIVNWMEDNNPKHWVWAWSYLQNITQRPLEQAWIPSSDAEKKAAVIATIDLSDNVDRKALVIDKMKKAWSQKKFREKSSGKKPYSISMTLNTKQKLNALAEEKDMKINEMIEFLVRSEYKKRDLN